MDSREIDTPIVGMYIVASGHTAPNTPDLFRTPKLTVAGPGQYWTGGPSGNTLGCCQLFYIFMDPTPPVQNFIWRSERVCTANLHFLAKPRFGV